MKTKGKTYLYHVLRLYWTPSKAYLMTGLWRSNGIDSKQSLSHDGALEEYLGPIS